MNKITQPKLLSFIFSLLIFCILTPPYLHAQAQGIILIESTPTGASVFLNDQPTGRVTPYQELKPAGEYTYRLEMEDYRDYTGKFTLDPGKTETLQVTLIPAFGSLFVESSPTGANIELDGKATGKVTPALLEKVSSGNHFITLSKENYASQTLDVRVSDGQQSRMLLNLEEQFGTLGVVTSPEADIYINGQKVATGIYSGSLSPGRHIIEARKENYHSTREEIEVIARDENRLMLQLEPRLGSLAVMTDPPRQDIYIDGELRGQSPLIINSIITGRHLIKVKHNKGISEIEAIVKEEEMNTITMNLRELPSLRIDPDVKAGNRSAQVNTSLLGGTVDILEKGIYLSTSGDFYIPEKKVIYGRGAGNYNTILEDLKPDTKYYVRSYLTTRDGVLLSEEISFETLEDWPFDTQTRVVEVRNPATGKTWMDRNLGASRVATSSTDAQAYGDLYQWGRASDGHQARRSGLGELSSGSFIFPGRATDGNQVKTSETSSTLSSSDIPGHRNFIPAPNSPYDWRNPQNDNLWQGVNGANNPCPPGYRLPIEAEWNAERQSWSRNNSDGAFTTLLKLPVAGYRVSSSGFLFNAGSDGSYWSSSADGTLSRCLSFSSSHAIILSSYRADGFSIRCIQDL